MAQRDRNPSNAQPKSNIAGRSRKQIPAKCVRCAMLSMAQVRSLHGETGDNCYVSAVCRSRRSYARHQRSRNQARQQQYRERSTGIQADRAATQPSADLIVYRAARYGAPIEFIAASVQQGKTKVAIVEPIYCAGLVPKQVYACLEAILATLQREYGIARFASVVQQLPEAQLKPQPPKPRSPRHREIAIALPGVTDCYSSGLVVYRQPAAGAIVALKVEVWRGATPEAEIPLLDCRGLLPSQVHAYLDQVLALLEAHYGIRWLARQAECPSESCQLLLEQTEPPIEADADAKTTFNLAPLWQALEEQLQQRELAPIESLEVVAVGVTEIVSHFSEFAALAFEELEAVAERGVMLPADAFDRYLRQSIEVNFEPFLEPSERLPSRAIGRSQLPDDGSSIVGELDQAALLQALDEQMAQESGLTEMEAFNRAIATAHNEDVSAWTEAIERQFDQQQEWAIKLPDLQQAIRVPLIQVWLAVLLGDFQLEQRGAFYDAQTLWVLKQT